MTAIVNSRGGHFSAGTRVADNREDLSVRYELAGDAGCIGATRSIVTRYDAERYAIDPSRAVDLVYRQVDTVLILNAVRNGLGTGRAKQVLPRLAGAGNEGA